MIAKSTTKGHAQEATEYRSYTLIDGISCLPSQPLEQIYSSTVDPGLSYGTFFILGNVLRICLGLDHKGMIGP